MPSPSPASAAAPAASVESVASWLRSELERFGVSFSAEVADAELCAYSYSVWAFYGCSESEDAWMTGFCSAVRAVFDAGRELGGSTAALKVAQACCRDQFASMAFDHLKDLGSPEEIPFGVLRLLAWGIKLGSGSPSPDAREIIDEFTGDWLGSVEPEES